MEEVAKVVGDGVEEDKNIVGDKAEQNLFKKKRGKSGHQSGRSCGKSFLMRVLKYLDM